MGIANFHAAGADADPAGAVGADSRSQPQATGVASSKP